MYVAVGDQSRFELKNIFLNFRPSLKGTNVNPFANLSLCILTIKCLTINKGTYWLLEKMSLLVPI